MEDYATLHRHPVNLLIHLATVPLFLLAVIGVVVGSFTSSWAGWWGASVAVGVYSLALQRFGHSLEARRPGGRPGFARAAGRLLLEQFVTFPAFVLSGGWQSSWRQAQQRGAWPPGRGLGGSRRRG